MARQAVIALVEQIARALVLGEFGAIWRWAAAQHKELLAR